MIYAAFFASALVTAGLFAFAARVMVGIEHSGVLLAIGVIGGGLQMLALIFWYLSHTRKTGVQTARADEPRG